MLENVGLWGDGDEVWALREVERRLGIKLDKVDAKSWQTLGDLYKSVLKALPAGQGQSDDLWRRFAEAICSETGADASQATPDTRLISRTNLFRHWWSLLKKAFRTHRAPG